MQRLFSMCLEAGIASLFLIPAFWSLNRFYFRNANRAAVCLVFSLYLAAVDAVAGLPCLLRFRFDRNLNLKPFAYLFSDFESSFLNVLLFIPLGLFLTVLWKRYRSFLRTILFGFGFSLAIELLQMFTRRATDVNDLMTNTLGAALGWCLGRMILRCFPSLRPSWKTGEVFVTFAVTFAVLFFLQPIPAARIWVRLRG